MRECSEDNGEPAARKMDVDEESNDEGDDDEKTEQCAG